VELFYEPLWQEAPRHPFDPLGSWCGEHATPVASLAIRLGSVKCGLDVLKDCIVDADSTALLCS
jgi:hypothetical protein